MSDLKTRLLDRVVQYDGCMELTLGAEQVRSLCTDLRTSAVSLTRLEAVLSAAKTLQNAIPPEWRESEELHPEYDKLSQAIRLCDEQEGK